MENKMLLSISEVATTLGVSRPTIYRLLYTEDFPVVHLGGRVLIPIKQLEDWIDAQVGNVKGGEIQ
mgnify:FL=1